MRSLKESISGMVDLGVVLMIGVAFVGLMLMAYIIFALKGQLIPTYPSTGYSAAANASRAAWNTSYRATYNSFGNITHGFDNAVALLLVAITIWILAIAISALLILRGRQE